MFFVIEELMSSKYLQYNHRPYIGGGGGASEQGEGGERVSGGDSASQELHDVHSQPNHTIPHRTPLALALSTLFLALHFPSKSQSLSILIMQIIV